MLAMELETALIRHNVYNMHAHVCNIGVYVCVREKRKKIESNIFVNCL